MSLASQLTPGQSEDIIFNELVAQGIPQTLAQLVTAQSGHETAGWTSNVYLIDNNAFGYGFTGVSYKSYTSVEASADDLAAYLQRRVADQSFPPLDQITTADQYAGLLQSAGYYTDSLSNYENGIANWLNTNLKVVAAAGSGLLIIFAIVAVILFNRNSRSY